MIENEVYCYINEFLKWNIKLSQEESDLCEPDLYISVQPDKSRKSEILTTFENIHQSFLNNLKSEETKCQIKLHLLYLANSFF